MSNLLDDRPGSYSVRVRSAYVTTMFYLYVYTGYVGLINVEITSDDIREIILLTQPVSFKLASISKPLGSPEVRVSSA
ncbi:hypothetical protein PILCRDRAFT_812193 [Piloderma croceum F 1598]|uniref:Uncharacterized protein n=1 Tax=Piloderma croceum (strain F 1598) TaxID=765440 RepID=A0A0C3GFI4_PILCF|nr:hypothetical protein PILCRDRAFT_812193 [Piloderma croceum F 1598]